MKNNEISLVMNTTEGVQSIRDSRDIRSVALFDKIPYFTTAAAANAAALAIQSYADGEIEVKPLQN
jgi:carbamoyl-phosphate synthase large subunit